LDSSEIPRQPPSISVRKPKPSGQFTGKTTFHRVRRRPILRLILSVLAAALFALPCQAQVAVYGLATFTAVEDIPAGTDLLIFTTTTAYLTNSATRPGFAGGALADIPHSGRFAVGLDLRETVSSGTTGGSLFTAAARLALVPRYSRMRPYALLGGGAASGHSPIFSGGGFTGPTLASSNGVFVYGFGMDVRLTHSFDLRAIDVLIANGHGPASTTPGFLGPIDTAYPGVSFFSIDTGILYRFGEARRPPH